MKFGVTLLKYKSFTCEGEDEIEIKESEEVLAQLNSEGWELADIQVEPMP